MAAAATTTTVALIQCAHADKPRIIIGNIIINSSSRERSLL